jgi:hypothetical protein
MLWFQKSRTENVETVSPVLHFKADRLAAVELEFRQAEIEFNAAFDRLKRHMKTHRDREPFAVGNTMFVPLNHRPNVERSILVHEESMARMKRDELLQERASLRRDLGLSR